MVVWWAVLPYAAVASCVVGHVWRYRRDGFRSFLYGMPFDRAQRFGIGAFRVGLPIVSGVRIIEAFASGPHSRPEAGIRAVLVIGQLVGVPLTVAGAVLILVPPLIAADTRGRVSPLDRMTLPLLAAALMSAILVTFDTNSTDNGYRSAETLFTWARSVFVLRPDPAVMAHAPGLYQARALIIILIVAVWPYTRLAGILFVPILRLLRQVAAALNPGPAAPLGGQG
ncbi:respiratory nitrate reductase subunit gamma [Nocardia sp. CDC160]|uniref:respiratory nitrate reductase subunit gamma n=1 Tax=Nocardia sp. CDC160 TaxID=3112166 RepID=UPI002DBC03D0|nr:respiratory nitrate reductase subunit gamma [Nocardia sp. CDC160]MEC3918752.1 respiratory nitrate reductase subunit gamma [Nocardia sp. CDC160]